MSAKSEITRLKNAKAALKTSIENKGVTVSSGALLDAYAACVDSIETPDASLYTGTTEPSSTLGNDGDVYIKL